MLRNKFPIIIGFIGLLIILLSGFAYANGYLDRKYFGVISCIGTTMIFCEVFFICVIKK